jgi:hypothetical protein
LSAAVLGPEESLSEGVNRVVRERDTAVARLKEELLAQPVHMQQATLSGSRRDMVLAGAIRMPGGRRVVCRHIGAYEEAGDAGLVCMTPPAAGRC